MLIAAAMFVLVQPEKAAEAAKPTEAPKCAIEYPHPLITEILYAVPSRDGDASKDGKRDVNGDEFIELVNPHDRVIQLGGYVLTDRDLKEGEKKFTSIRFKFPVLELKPGEVVVVFNGHDQSWTGSVGDSAKAPDKCNDLFAGARVFTMGVTSDKQGLANKGDCVQLVAPDGKVVHCIHWGDAKAGEGVAKEESAPVVSNKSVERKSAAGAFESCPVGAFSPGVWPPAKPKTDEAKSDESKTAEKKPEAK